MTSVPEPSAPTTVPDLLDAASALVAGGLEVVAAINTAVHGTPETRTGSPLTAEAKATLVRGIDPDHLAEWPITAPDSVLAHWGDEVPSDEAAATMRRVAEVARTAEHPLP